MSHLLLSVMGAFAQFERDLIRERQREGIALRNCAKGLTWVGSTVSTSTGKDLRRRVATAESKTALAGELGSVVRLYIDTLQEQGSEVGAQRVMHCPCGQPKVLARGLCSTCYTFKRQDDAYFGGHREEVLKRDGYRCRVIGCTTLKRGKRSVAVHHREPGNNDPATMITLCLSCHAKVPRNLHPCIVRIPYFL